MWGTESARSAEEDEYSRCEDLKEPSMTRVRPATPTVACIDDYCAQYRSVFHNVRHFEQFTQLILGMLAETKRKSLPRLAKMVQGEHQALHRFLANAE
jgi:SRSO17 transposase